MSQINLEGLKAIMLRCSGVDEGITLDDTILDTEFGDLGYDSLAVLEIASQLQREYGLKIPDEAIEEMETPRSVIDYVNSSLAAV